MKNRKLILSIISIILAVTISFGAIGCSGGTIIDPNDNIAATEIDLVKGGVSEYIIVIPENASNYEEYAAEELQLFLKQSTGATLDIVKDTGRSFNQEDKVISVGETEIYTASGLNVSYDEFKRDGFKIKRYGNTLVLCGGGGYGTLYAVYEFLAREIDWEAYSVDEIYFRKTQNLKVLDFNFADKPALESRYGGWWVARADSYFAAKWRVFAGSSNMLFNETSWYYYPHALFKIVNPEAYGAEHPDWFATSMLQPCYSSEGFRTTLIEGMKKILLANPSIVYMPIGPEDAVNATCVCKDCLEEQELYTYSGQVVRWANSVAEEMEEWRIEQGIERQIYYPVLAYYETKVPPINRNAAEGVFEPIDESCVLNELSPVLYAPIEGNFSRPIDDPDYNRGTYNDLQGWLACSKSFMGYYYNNDFFRRFEWPYPIETTVHNYKVGIDNGAIFIGDDHGGGSQASCAFDIMLGYVYSKVLWNPNVDVNKLINNFITHFYKDAKEEMYEYYYMMENTRKATRDIFDAQGAYAEAKDWLSKGLLERAKKLIEKGMQDIANNPNYTAKERETYLSRMELAYLTPLVYILDYCSSDYTAKEYLSIVDQVESLVNKYGLIITATYSYSKTNEQKYAEWRGNKA